MAYLCNGSFIVKVAPFPTLLDTDIDPPWASMIFLVI